MLLVVCFLCSCKVVGIVSFHVDHSVRLLFLCVCSKGSEKAWHFLADPMTPYRLGLAVTILPPIEQVLHRLFIFQRDSSWLSSDVGQLPLVLMTDTQHSPAVQVLDQLVRCLFGQSELAFPSTDLDSVRFIYRYANLHKSGG